MNNELSKEDLEYLSKIYPGMILDNFDITKVKGGFQFRAKDKDGFSKLKNIICNHYD
jgi:hypothetical protein